MRWLPESGWLRSRQVTRGPGDTGAPSLWGAQSLRAPRQLWCPCRGAVRRQLLMTGLRSAQRLLLGLASVSRKSPAGFSPGIKAFRKPQENPSLSFSSSNLSSLFLKWRGP